MAPWTSTDLSSSSASANPAVASELASRRWSERNVNEETLTPGVLYQKLLEPAVAKTTLLLDILEYYQEKKRDLTGNCAAEGRGRFT